MNKSVLKKWLDFSYDKKRVYGFSKTGFNRTVLDKNLERLYQIGEKYLEPSDILPMNQIHLLHDRLLGQWRDKVKAIEVSLKTIEARSIGFGIEQADSHDFVKYLHAVVENNWTPSCVKGFLYGTLIHWLDNPKVREVNVQFIARHVQEVGYESILPFIASEKGPIALAETLRKQGKSIMKAPSFVMMPYTRINYSFFSNTIIAYYSNASRIDYEELSQILKVHNTSRTDKILLPRLILKKKVFSRNLLEISNNRIGDPFNESKWAPFDGATKKESEDLQSARRIVLSWIMQEVIRLFFDLLCQDKARKDFWIKHAHQMKSFRVYGSMDSRRKIMDNTQLPSIMEHFKSVAASSDNTALAMFFPEYVIVEFTKVGALYAYKLDGQNYRDAFRFQSYLSRVDELKMKDPPLLYDTRNGYESAEGKMDHRGDWARRMNRWMRKHMMLE